jgi:phage major head subunit gpT-like protein
MQITPSALTALSQGFQAAFLEGIKSVNPKWPLVAMEVSSKARLENYGWMKDLPGMREWIGDRVINNLETTNYQIVNKHFEQTIGVDRDDIEDDTLGIYRNRFSMQGEIAAQHSDTLIWLMLLAGFATTGLDGQYFFDTDHIGYDATGAEVSYSNTGGGSSAPWFLMDLSRTYMKPLVMQNRQAVKFSQQTQESDDAVFLKRQFLYGVDARYNAGFGFHQLAYASKSTFDATAFEASKVAMGTQKRPDGSSLNVMPTTLLVGPTNEAAARKVIGVQQLASGATNPWYNNVAIEVIPALG